MESLEQSKENSDDFEFKYIPKFTFDRILRDVKSKRKPINEEGMWDGFYEIASELGQPNPIKKNHAKNMTPKKDGIALYHKQESDADKCYLDYSAAVDGDDPLVIPSCKAPFFGPPKKMEEITTKESKNTKIHEEDANKLKCSSNVSFHIVDEIYDFPGDQDHQLDNVIQNSQVADRQIKVSKLITTSDDVSDKKESVGSASDNDETLCSDILDLCNEIENLNEMKEENDMIQGEIRDERNHLRCESNKTKMELIDKTYATYMDDELDFLQDEFEFSSSSDNKLKRQINSQPVDGLRLENFNQKIDEPVNEIPKAQPQQRKLSGSEKIDENDNNVAMIAKEMIKVERNQRTVNAEATKEHKTHQEKEKVKSRPDTKDSTASLESLVELQRVWGFQENICQYLDRLYEILNNPPQIDDIMDLNKRKKRSTEFTNRFARNHLYQIGRLAEKLRLMPDNPLDLAIQVNSIFQSIMQASQIYLKNIEMFIYNKNPDKLLVLVDFIINASKICFDRRVFDKKDAIFMKMLKKCAEVREILDMHRNSKAVNYEPLRRKNEQFYDNFDDDDDDFYEYTQPKNYTLPRKLKNPYGMPKSTPRHQKNSNGLSKNIHKESKLASKSHYEAPKNRYVNPYDKPKNPCKAPSMQMKSKQSSVRSNLHSVRSTFVRATPPKSAKPPQTNLKKTASEISTAVQKEMEQENDINVIQTVSEKPLENENGSSNEIMKMIENITKEKFEEMFAPLLAKLVPKNDTKSCRDEEIKSSVHRVTADIQPLKKSTNEPKRPSSSETVQRFAHNVQYMFIKSENGDCNSDDVSEKTGPLKDIEPKIEPSSKSKTVDNMSKDIEKSSETIEKPSTTDKKAPKAVEKVDMKITEKSQIESNNSDSSDDDDDSDYEEETEEQKMAINKLREQAMKERLEILEKISKNPLYGTEQIKEPWTVVSDLSDEILDELIEEVLKELEINDEEILESFLRHELAC